MTGLKRILVPTDFSDASKEALRYACELAKGVNASVTILYVFEPCPVHPYAEGCAFSPEYLERAEREIRSDLENLLSAAEKREYNATCILLNGPVVPAILSYLNEHDDVDLVVMATHGRGGAARLMLGSVTDKVVRAAPCPVLTLKGSDVPELKASRVA